MIWSNLLNVRNDTCEPHCHLLKLLARDQTVHSQQYRDRVYRAKIKGVRALAKNVAQSWLSWFHFRSQKIMKPEYKTRRKISPPGYAAFPLYMEPWSRTCMSITQMYYKFDEFQSQSYQRAYYDKRGFEQNTINNVMCFIAGVSM